MKTYIGRERDNRSTKPKEKKTWVKNNGVEGSREEKTYSRKYHWDIDRGKGEETIEE